MFWSKRSRDEDIDHAERILRDWWSPMGIFGIEMDSPGVVERYFADRIQATARMLDGKNEYWDASGWTMLVSFAAHIMRRGGYYPAQVNRLRLLMEAEHPQTWDSEYTPHAWEVPVEGKPPMVRAGRFFRQDPTGVSLFYATRYALSCLVRNDDYTSIMPDIRARDREDSLFHSVAVILGSVRFEPSEKIRSELLRIWEAPKEYKTLPSSAVAEVASPKSISDKDYRAMAEYAIANGFVLQKMPGGHFRLLAPDGVGVLVFSSTSASRRGFNNARSMLNRMLAPMGLRYK